MKFLVLFWLTAWLIHPHPYPPPSRGRDIFLGPLTIAEKILLGYPLAFRQLSEKDWEMIPRIGPALAKRIVAYQTKNGAVVKLEDLDAIPGIGPKTIEGLRQFFDTPNPQNFSF